MVHCFSRLGVMAVVSLLCLPRFGTSDCHADEGIEANSTRTEMFAKDPDWEGFRNLLRPAKLPVVRQDFGYQPTQFAGGTSPGEIGGTIQRSLTRARYSTAIKSSSLNDTLSASGKLAVTNGRGGAGVMIGWFNQNSRGWRTPNSLAFRLDGNGDKFWVFYEYGTNRRKTGGGGAFEGERYQTTPTLPFPADGKSHNWSLTYDPNAQNGAGEITFQIDDRVYAVPLAPGHKPDGATFDRFGIWNVETSGDSMDVYFDDLVVDGKEFNFDSDPKWIGEGNKVQFTERVIRPYHNFGYQPSNYAGGEPGEIGGIFFRDEQPAYYAADVGRLDLKRPLFASGKVAFREGGADSGIIFGWFNSNSKRNKETPEYEKRQTDYLGVMVEGPSRVGHYFRATYSNSHGSGGAPFEMTDANNQRTVILPDGKPHEWSLLYDPQAAGGNGRITVIFDGRSHTLDLKPGEREQGATFDRFGFFNIQAGGHHVDIYFDELVYTVGQK